jgi:hypothetical protein
LFREYRVSRSARQGNDLTSQQCGAKLQKT